jgi:chromosome segregation ATPase
MANMIEQALEIKKEEEKRVRHALESVLRDVKTCEEKKLAVLEELAHSDECVRRVKGEKESLDSQIAILETRRKGEENKARTVREQLSDRIRDVESEVERLSKLYRELSSKVGEAESSLRDKQEELAAMSREQEQQREAWEVDLHQLRNQQAVLAEQVRGEEATLQSAHAATKKAELENTRQIRAAESVLLSLRREEKDGRDCVERLRDEARGVRKELATLVQDKETQKAMFKEQERKHDLQHKAQKTEEEEVHRRLQEGKRALASDLAACQAAKELLQALADKEDGMKRSNDEIRDIAQHLAHDVDRLQKDCETWKAKADQERHALSALRTQKTVVERELRLLKEDVATSAEAVQQIKEKEEQQLKVLEEARAQETQLQDQVSLLKRRVADAERAESVLLARCDEVKRDVERSTRTKEAHAQAAHEELMQTEKLQAEKTRLRESILQLERESRHAESGHHQALLAQDKAKIGVEGVEKELCKVKGDLLSLREEKEKQERAIDNATVALRAMEVQVTEGRETLAAVERRAQREAERATQEEDRVEAKKQELSALEHQVREAQTLLSQTYDSMHVERARALKELEQFEGMKLEAQHQLYTAQKAGSLTAQQPVLVQHDSSPPANMTEREKVLVGSLPPPPRVCPSPCRPRCVCEYLQLQPQW